MSRLKNSFTTVMVFAIGVVTTAINSPLSGQEVQVVVPNIYESSEGNAIGYSASFGFPIKSQEVFPSSEFASVPDLQRWITGYRLRPDAIATLPRTINYGDVQIRMSTTPKGPNDLSFTFADNVGPDETIVLDTGEFSVTAKAASGPGPRPFDYVYQFDTPFYYDPNQGNLLLEFRSRSGWVNASPIFDAHDDVYGAAGISIGAANFSSNVATVRFPVEVYQFTFAVPELQSVTLAGIGLLALLAIRTSWKTV
ncbi:MAG: hypothetical protein R3E01_03335 [Pirellulaceae bacterium]